jgi:hypothetical protein
MELVADMLLQMVPQGLSILVQVVVVAGTTLAEQVAQVALELLLLDTQEVR